MSADFPDISSLVRAYFKAFDERNREALEPVLADEFRFTSPYEEAIDRAAFFEQCWPYGDIHKSHSIERIVPDGETAFVTYLLTRKDGSASRNTEYFAARNGKITPWMSISAPTTSTASSCRRPKPSPRRGC